MLAWIRRWSRKSDRLISRRGLSEPSLLPRLLQVRWSTDDLWSSLLEIWFRLLLGILTAIWKELAFCSFLLYGPTPWPYFHLFPLSDSLIYNILPWSVPNPPISPWTRWRLRPSKLRNPTVAFHVLESGSCNIRRRDDVIGKVIIQLTETLKPVVRFVSHLEDMQVTSDPLETLSKRNFGPANKTWPFFFAKSIMWSRRTIVRAHPLSRKTWPTTPLVPSSSLSIHPPHFFPSPTSFRPPFSPQSPSGCIPVHRFRYRRSP